MVDVNDASGAVAYRDRQREAFKNADIDERDREAGLAWTAHRRAHGARGGSYAPRTEGDDFNKLRLAAERAAVPLTEMGLNDVNALLNLLTRPKDHPDGGYGISTGIDAYTRALRPFFRWLDAHDEYPDFPWHEEVETGNVDFPDPSDRRFPTQDEIDAMVDEARANQSPRDVAIVSYYAESAVRRTLGAQLLVDSIDIRDGKGWFIPNPDGEAQKDTAVKEYPLYSGVAELRTWLNVYHPDPDNDAAPLWTHPPDEYRRHRDPAFCHRQDCRTELPDEPETCPSCGKPVVSDGAIRASQIGRIFRKYGRRAGLDPDEVELKPHAFRHAAIGRWKERGYSLPQVQRRTAWKDRSAAEMWAQYGDPDDGKIDEGIDEIEGHATPDDGDEAEAPTAPERRTCGNCPADGITSDHCPNCGAPVSPEARQEHMEAADVSIEELYPAVRQMVLEFLQEELTLGPELQQAIETFNETARLVEAGEVEREDLPTLEYVVAERERPGDS